ncbi:MAG: ABC transporter substrate-binding protein [Muribaculaceae bacterium]|nr:ABC transporter substrate-binding protein [Muribaculaceae bacterium]
MNSFRHIYAILLLLALVSCGSRQSQKELKDFVEVYTPSYAKGFSILGSPNAESVILEMRNPWQGARDEVRRVFIRRGNEEAPAGFDGTVVDAAIERIVCMSSSHVAMLRALDDVEKLVGMSCLDYVSDSIVNSRLDKIVEIGYETNVNYENLVAVNPDVVLLYGVECASPMETKLKSLGIPYIYIGDYLEDSPLGKAEWIVAISEIMGKRQQGEQVFAAIPEKYNRLKALADSLPERPVVMLNTPYADSWVMPPVTSYSARLISDAGGKYVCANLKNDKLLTVGVEEAWQMAKNADVWLQTGAISRLDDLKAACPRFVDTKPILTGNVWNCDLKNNSHGGNDYWESGVIHPDLILRDLIKIFHPEVLKDEPFVYYRKI